VEKSFSLARLYFQAKGQELMTWRILNLVRAVLISLGWFIVSLRPSTDRLTKNLTSEEVTWAEDESNKA